MFQALIAAVNETSDDDIREALRTQTEHQLALVPRGPRVVKDTVAYKTTVDRDDTVRLCNLLDPVTVAIALVVILIGTFDGRNWSYSIFE